MSKQLEQYKSIVRELDRIKHKRGTRKNMEIAKRLLDEAVKVLGYGRG